MGRHANSSLSNAFGWILFALMTASLATWLVFAFR
jgi:hypothetical protein